MRHYPFKKFFYAILPVSVMFSLIYFAHATSTVNAAVGESIDTVFQDYESDGIQDAGEPVVPTAVTLVNADALISFAKTRVIIFVAFIALTLATLILSIDRLSNREP